MTAEIGRRLRQLHARRRRLRMRGRVLDALALHRRGEVRPDGLLLNKCEQRLEIEWQARQIHPWDRNLPKERKAELFAAQCLEDSAAALDRLFHRLPEIDVIAFRVLHPISKDRILTGCVMRSEIRGAKTQSPGMRLKNLGVTYRLNNWQFEALT